MDATSYWLVAVRLKGGKESWHVIGAGWSTENGDIEIYPDRVPSLDLSKVFGGLNWQVSLSPVSAFAVPDPGTSDERGPEPRRVALPRGESNL
jgi:hypothetical protein